ncbi:MAG: hypothetical protein Ct9H300mP12_17570 [Acidimicrobiales bacterium]|nr:MAG: hypothetical protein Ct9H300mP12_17570 [Acidimicrobiales bacterium]
MADGVEDPKFDANVIAYVATGVWHHWLLPVTGASSSRCGRWWNGPPTSCSTCRRRAARSCGPAIPTARLVVRPPDRLGQHLPQPPVRGGLPEEMGHERPDWELSLGHLAHVVRTRPAGAFAPKDRWAWTGTTRCWRGDHRRRGSDPLASRRNDSYRRPLEVAALHWAWVRIGQGLGHAAETSECAMAHLLAGDQATAIDLFRATLPMRQRTAVTCPGIVYPDLVTFPTDECSTYPSAAVVLAPTPSAAEPSVRLFVDHRGLPDVIVVEEPSRRAPVPKTTEIRFRGQTPGKTGANPRCLPP